MVSSFDNDTPTTHLILMGEETGEDQRLLLSGPFLCTPRMKEAVEKSHQIANSSACPNLTTELAQTDNMHAHTHTHTTHTTHTHTHTCTHTNTCTHPTVEGSGHSCYVHSDEPAGLEGTKEQDTYCHAYVP